jgi:hypothetical protein
MSFKVPKVKAQLTIFFTGGSSVSGEIFLSPQSPYRYGKENMLDLLNSEEPFFPLEAETTSSIRLINKNNVLFITTHEEKEEKDSGKSVTVTVVCKDGEHLVGDLTIEEPEYRSRVLDFLNGNKGLFFRLETKQKIYYINVQYVSEVLP